MTGTKSSTFKRNHWVGNIAQWWSPLEVQGPHMPLKKKKNQYLTLPVADESETCCLVHTSTGLLASSTESLPSPAGAHYLKLMPHLQPSLGAPETGIVRRKGQISTVGEFTIYVHFKRHFPEAADSDSLTFLFFVFF